MDFGKAEVGDKTLVDVLVPFADTLTAAVAAAAVRRGLAQAAEAAEQAAEATPRPVPRMGRARPHAEKSLGTPDAGAVSLSLILRAVADRLAVIYGGGRSRRRCPDDHRTGDVRVLLAVAGPAAGPLTLAEMIDKTAGWDVTLFQICDYPLIETYDDAALAALRRHAADAASGWSSAPVACGPST